MVHLKYRSNHHVYLIYNRKVCSLLYKYSTNSSSTNTSSKNNDFEEKLTSIPSLIQNQASLVFNRIKVIWNFFNQRIKRKNSIVIFFNNFYYLFNLHLFNYYASIHLLTYLQPPSICGTQAIGKFSPLSPILGQLICLV